jgi:hypothetical protein
MRKQIVWSLIAAYAVVGAAAWLAPSRLERIAGPDFVVFGQTIGLPVFWALSAGVNVAIMAAIVGLLALIGWLLSRRAL